MLKEGRKCNINSWWMRSLERRKDHKQKDSQHVNTFTFNRPANGTWTVYVGSHAPKPIAYTSLALDNRWRLVRNAFVYRNRKSGLTTGRLFFPFNELALWNRVGAQQCHQDPGSSDLPRQSPSWCWLLTSWLQDSCLRASHLCWKPGGEEPQGRLCLY